MSRVLIMFLFCLSALSTAAGTGPVDEPAGPAFSNPLQLQEMPEEWKKRPLKYAADSADADIVVTLDQHLFAALLPFIDEYSRKKNLKIVVNEGTCGISAGMLTRKSVDIGGFCCAPGKTDRLPGLKFHTIGIDAIAILVHPDNPVRDITIHQARELFSGGIMRWSEIIDLKGRRGSDIPVYAVGRLHCKLRPGHWRLLLDKESMFSPYLQEVGAISDMIAQVALNPGSIGYEVVWNTRRYRDRGRVRILKIDGRSPLDHEALISGRYPLYRVYNLTSWEGPGLVSEEAQMLVRYLIDKADTLQGGHNIIPASVLRSRGWRFRGDELVGEP